MPDEYALPKSMEELLERYRAGERRFVGCNLDDRLHDLRNQDLAGINLSGSFILADFRGANLRGSDFSHSNVKTCDFRRADLTEATFQHASIDSAMFEGAKLEGANFENAGAYGYSLKKGEIPD